MGAATDAAGIAATRVADVTEAVRINRSRARRVKQVSEARIRIRSRPSSRARIKTGIRIGIEIGTGTTVSAAMRRTLAPGSREMKDNPRILMHRGSRLAKGQALRAMREARTLGRAMVPRAASAAMGKAAIARGIDVADEDVAVATGREIEATVIRTCVQMAPRAARRETAANETLASETAKPIRRRAAALRMGVKHVSRARVAMESPDAAIEIVVVGAAAVDAAARAAVEILREEMEAKEVQAPVRPAVPPERADRVRAADPTE